jgi:hypothetical protein
VKKIGTGQNTAKTEPEKVLREFVLSQSNAENAISLWMDSIGAINMERGDYATIDGWDKLRSAIHVNVQNRR